MKKVLVLGASGSIGRQAIEVIDAHRDNLALAGFSCHADEAALLRIKAAHPAARACLSGRAASDPRIELAGEGALERLIAGCGADVCVNGVAGAAGLAPSIAALGAGMDLALANKETAVMAGELVTGLAARTGRKILPVDSEHSALFHLLAAFGRDRAESLTITASGGPFRRASAEEIERATPEAALRHPSWSMGRKITVDSASLANKGLEVIEACVLFGLPPERVRVLVHPQSLVHGLLRTRDGQCYAQLSRPDMRLPIRNALFWPATPQDVFGALELAGRTLEFEEPDGGRFPMLPLAYRVAAGGRAGAIIYNAANEVAVEAFLAGRARFGAIPRIVEGTLARLDGSSPADSLGVILETDAAARAVARGIAQGMED